MQRTDAGNDKKEANETDRLLTQTQPIPTVQALRQEVDPQPGCSPANYMWLFSGSRRKASDAKKPDENAAPSFCVLM